jgi:hypothetical protein
LEAAAALQPPLPPPPRPFTCSQNAEVLLPMPAYMEAFFIVLEGDGYIGGDSAIDPEQEEQGLYQQGTGKFDFSKSSIRKVGSRVFKGVVGSLAHTRPRTLNRGYGGIGEWSPCARFPSSSPRCPPPDCCRL